MDATKTMNTMRALVKKEPVKGLWLEDVPVPGIGINDVLIKVLRTAICGTDLHIYNWNDWAKKKVALPSVIGHEFVGAVAEIGSNVNDFAKGQIVSGEGHVVCGRCRNCIAGRRHMCAYASGVGVDRPGAFAQFVSLPMTNVWEHRPGIDLDVAAMFDPFGNAVHAALQFSLINEDVLITGAGPVGCMAAAVCKRAGARHIVVTDINPTRLKIALGLGATRGVDVRSEQLADVRRELGIGEGFDVGLEMSGSPMAFNDMIAHMCHGGKISLIGIPENEVSIDWSAVIFNMLTIKGVCGREMYETWYRMSLMIEDGLDISSLVTHRLHYTDFEAGFQAVCDGRAGKVILDWSR